jgi:outer membrane lipoprotein-sorting protein
MSKLLIISFLFNLLPAILITQSLTGEYILKKIDKNLVLDEAVSTTTMIIHSRSGTRTIKSRSWVHGKEKAFVEYLDPPRERGKKMLRLDDNIWDYIPEPTDRIITISGHLLKQSVMGSDLSYEDVTENRKLFDMYDAKIENMEEFNGRECYVILLTAKEADITYYSRKVWADKERWLPLKEERYAKSGRLLKKTEIQEVMKVDNRWYPKKMNFKDMLLSGEGTDYIIDSIDFNVDIPEYKFTKAALRK